MTAPERRLSRSVVSRYAIGSIGTGGFATLPGLVLVFYLTDTLGVTALLAGLVVTAAKVWDVIIDPWIGERSDAALARTGTRRTWMRVGAIALPIAFVVTFAAPAGPGRSRPGFGCSWRSSPRRRRSASSRCPTSHCPPNSPTTTTHAPGC
ncbi:hypothetical protein GCM10025870_30200 [Agromyces marinus]|uniref:MFS/sugar transport protein n=1 Tax=Agromyces marinus TaxID=1389020 RepID=A0ABM8H576_9MICO|nr:hypothetical protein GCM10025870_30200 [Agromyces marinus]